MKVLHIIDSGGIHGAEVMLLGLAAEQIRQGVKPMILSIGLPREGEKPIEIAASKEKIPFFPIRMKTGLNLLGAYRIVQFARKNNFQIYHVHGYKAHILIGFLPKFITKMPIIATVHGWTSAKKWSVLGLYRLIDEISLRYMDYVVFVNKGAMNLHVASKIGKRAQVIPNGITPLQHSKSFQLDKKVTEFCKGSYVVGSIGRLSAEKAYQQLIEAFSQFCEYCSNAKLLIIGEGKERALLEQIVSNCGIRDKVLLPGYFSEAWRYMYLLNVYTISSLTEGLPITLLEAMQCRIPIISTAVGGIPDVILDGKSGILYKSGDKKALVQGLVKLYKDEAFCKKMVESAYNIAIKQYTCKSMTTQYIALYKNMKLKYN